MSGQSSDLERVIARSWPYWCAEFEIGYAAFSAANIYCETGWLAAQIWKEWSGSGVYGPAGTDLETVTSSASAEEELSHFHALKALGALMDVPPCEYVPCVAARELVSFRNRHWEDARLRHGVRMSEGGGLGLFHGAIAAIDEREGTWTQDKAVRDCLSRIIGDEIGHLGGAIADFLSSRFAGDKEVLDVLAECLARKVDERKEQFAPQLKAETVAPEDMTTRYRKDIGARLSVL